MPGTPLRFAILGNQHVTLSLPFTASPFLIPWSATADTNFEAWLLISPCSHASTAVWNCTNTQPRPPAKKRERAAYFRGLNLPITFEPAEFAFRQQQG
jgi:hypothetical protein